MYLKYFAIEFGDFTYIYRIKLYVCPLFKILLYVTHEHLKKTRVYIFTSFSINHVF